MGPDGALRDDPSQYPGEDTRLTSTKELAGWYAYGFAAEVFVICGVGELRHSLGSSCSACPVRAMAGSFCSYAWPPFARVWEIS